jgi:hypothetical protein
MSEPLHEPARPENGEARHLPVPAPVPEARPVERPGADGQLQRLLASLPAPAFAAAGGFMMGVLTWVTVRVLRRGRRDSVSARGRRGRGRRGRGVEVAATRSFLVDVHLLKDR